MPRRASAVIAAPGMTRAMGDGLIEKRQRIAHRAFRRAGDEAQRLGLDGHGLLGADRGQIMRQHVRPRRGADRISGSASAR